jgi:hypothetical protein
MGTTFIKRFTVGSGPAPHALPCFIHHPGSAGLFCTCRSSPIPVRSVARPRPRALTRDGTNRGEPAPCRWPLRPREPEPAAPLIGCWLHNVPMMTSLLSHPTSASGEAFREPRRGSSLSILIICPPAAIRSLRMLLACSLAGRVRLRAYRAHLVEEGDRRRSGSRSAADVVLPVAAGYWSTCYEACRYTTTNPLHAPGCRHRRAVR